MITIKYQELVTLFVIRVVRCLVCFHACCFIDSSILMCFDSALLSVRHCKGNNLMLMH